LPVVTRGLGNQLGVDPTADEMIATTPCTHLGCEAPPARSCNADAQFYERTQVHRGRWLKAERDRRVPGRIIYAPVSGRIGRSSFRLHADRGEEAESGVAERGGKPTYSSHPCSAQSPESACPLSARSLPLPRASRRAIALATFRVPATGHLAVGAALPSSAAGRRLRVADAVRRPLSYQRRRAAQGDGAAQIIREEQRFDGRQLAAPSRMEQSVEMAGGPSQLVRSGSQVPVGSICARPAQQSSA
jgi:hypothetical protein